MIGELLGERYRVVRLLGEGGMGSVFEAIQEPLGRRVALKVISPSLAREKVYMERFRREAEAAARLGHPNIIEVTDFEISSTKDYSFLVMEFLTGESLLEPLKRGPMHPVRAVGIAMQTLSGLAAAHRAGIIHRDIKPANVYLVPVGDGRVLAKVLDFGVAKLTDSATYRRLTQTGVMIGTPRFAAPEQLMGGKVDGRCDVYAMGVLLYCMVTGRPPFVTKGARLVTEVCKRVPEPVVHWKPSLPANLSFLIARAMAKRPDERPESAEAMKLELFSILEDLTGAQDDGESRTLRGRYAPLHEEIPDLDEDLIDADEKTHVYLGGENVSPSIPDTRVGPLLSGPAGATSMPDMSGETSPIPSQPHAGAVQPVVIPETSTLPSSSVTGPAPWQSPVPEAQRSTSRPAASVSSSPALAQNAPPKSLPSPRTPRRISPWLLVAAIFFVGVLALMCGISVALLLPHAHRDAETEHALGTATLRQSGEAVRAGATSCPLPTPMPQV